MGATEARERMAAPGTFPGNLANGAMVAADAAETGLDWADLERQDWHLWIMAMLLLFVLGVSLLSFMFPTVFWFGGDLAVEAPQRAFFGFCVLLALVLVYMLQRQATVRRLKRSLYQAMTKASEAEQTASLMAFVALPEFSQFRDSLAMEYRRASRTGDHVAVLLLDLPNASRAESGRAASEIHNVLRKGETLFRLSDAKFGVILPGTASADAVAFGDQIKDRLNVRFPHQRMSLTAMGYPEDVETLAEFEARLRTKLQ